MLKPVNQRAQTRVPPPEDVDLGTPIDRAALDSVLSVEVSEGFVAGAWLGDSRLTSIESCLFCASIDSPTGCHMCGD